MCKINTCTPSTPCHWCKRRNKKPTPIKRTPLKKKVYKIKRRSDKRAKQERQYSPIAKQWKVKNDKCKARLPGCTGTTEHVHHMMGKENHMLLLKEYWLPVCPNCHIIIGVMPIEEAIEKGVSLRRNVEISKRK